MFYGDPRILAFTLRAPSYIEPEPRESKSGVGSYANKHLMLRASLVPVIIVVGAVIAAQQLCRIETRPTQKPKSTPTCEQRKRNAILNGYTKEDIKECGCPKCPYPLNFTIPGCPCPSPNSTVVD
jgi:hypothetical protein